MMDLHPTQRFAKILDLTEFKWISSPQGIRFLVPEGFRVKTRIILASLSIFSLLNQSIIPFNHCLTFSLSMNLYNLYRPLAVLISKCSLTLC